MKRLHSLFLNNHQYLSSNRERHIDIHFMMRSDFHITSLTPEVNTEAVTIGRRRRMQRLQTNRF